MLIYRSADGNIKIDVRMGEETVWLTQDQMATLFGKAKSTINEHLKNIFSEGELVADSVIRNFRTTAADGKSYDTNYYNLDVIISVGYRVKSHQGTQFRIWATQVLREYLIKGFALNDERMKSGKSMNYFDELQERIREIRLSERVFYQKVKDIYIRAITDTFGNVPYAVANDGDVSALAGAMSLEEDNVLGIAMGTSEAVGYVDPQGRITGWLNELAFVPVDAAPDAMRDEWSGDIGCGVKYFSQDAVIKLAPRAGIALDESLSPAEKLKVVQKLMAEDDPRAADVYASIGVYLAHTLALYFDLYHFHHVLLLGRVMSGKGGDLILSTCKEVMADEYPEIAARINPTLPDEKFRRVGQSAAAASLPEIVK